MKPILLFLTCVNKKEAEAITQTLLGKRLVACIKQTPVASSFLFHGKIDHANEILLIIESLQLKFNEIEKEIRKIHSYKTFVLTAVPIIKTSRGVEQWLKENIE